MLSLLSDGVPAHPVAHQVKASIQTVVLWKRKPRHLAKAQESIVLSGKTVVDETYIRVPAKERGKIRKRGLPKGLMQIAVAVDEKGRSLALPNGKGRASKIPSGYSGTISRQILSRLTTRAGMERPLRSPWIPDQGKPMPS